MDQLTHTLNQMIAHQRLAELQPAGSQLQEDHHREALRYRAEAHKLDRQIKITRQSIATWLNLN